MANRLLIVVLLGTLLLGMAGCSPTKLTPTATQPPVDKPTLSEGEVIANVQMKGIPLLGLKDVQPLSYPPWTASYIGKGAWKVMGNVSYTYTQTMGKYAGQPGTSTRSFVWYYYEKTGAVRLQ